MALVTNGYWLTVTLTDASGSNSTLEFQLRAASAVDAALAAGVVIAELEEMTISVVSGYSVSERFYEDALVLPVGAENTMKAVMTVQLAGSNKKAVLRIPAPAPAVFASQTGSGANQVLLTRQETLDYVDLFTATGECFISDGETAAPVPESLISGRRTSVRSSNP